MLLTWSGAMQPTQAQAVDKYLIRFKTREFTPTPGLELAEITSLRAGAPSDPVHFLLQFHALPDASERQQLAGQDLALLNYVTGNAYVAVSSVANLSMLRNLPSVRWAGPILPDDKISTDLHAGNIGPWAMPDQNRLVLTIQFHPDVGATDAQSVVTRLGGTIVST